MSTPLRWDEVNEELDPSAFTMDVVLDRVRRDRWIADDDEGDSGHRRVVLDDQLREGRLVALGGSPDRRLQLCRVAHGHIRHIK